MGVLLPRDHLQYILLRLSLGRRGLAPWPGDAIYGQVMPIPVCDLDRSTNLELDTFVAHALLKIFGKNAFNHSVPD